MRARPIQLACLLLTVFLAGCTADGPAPQDDSERDEAGVAARQAAESAAAAAGGTATPPAPTCDASQAQGQVGKPVDDAWLEQARVDTGAERVRVLKPGQPVTMEFDGARLNVEVDADGKVASLRCG